MSVSFTSDDEASYRNPSLDPQMTSFRELASSRDSPMQISGYSDTQNEPDYKGKENRDKAKGKGWKS